MTSGRLQLRRAAQVNAEVVAAELKEMSMRGQRQHAANGYQHGAASQGGQRPQLTCLWRLCSSATCGMT